MINILNGTNCYIKDNTMYFADGKKLYKKEFNYSLRTFLTHLKKIRINRIGTNSDLNHTLENSKIPPFSIVFDYLTFNNAGIPNYDEFLNKYKELFCIEENGLLKFKKNYSNKNFSFTYEALGTRVYKIYFSFIREYHLYIKLKSLGLDVYLDRRDDYMDRMDIGVKIGNIFYIIDTSLDSVRSNEKEQNKENAIRRERTIEESSMSLARKYGCDYYCRIGFKAFMYNDNENYNTYKINGFALYNDFAVNILVRFLRSNIDKRNMKVIYQELRDMRF